MRAESLEGLVQRSSARRSSRTGTRASTASTERRRWQLDLREAALAERPDRVGDLLRRTGDLLTGRIGLRIERLHPDAGRPADRGRVAPTSAQAASSMASRGPSSVISDFSSA